MSENKVVLITGAAKRIGAGIARTFHRQGYDVIVHFNHSAEDAERLITELNHERNMSAVALQADLTDPSQVKALAASVCSQFGRLDVLVNNASAFYPSAYGEVSAQQWDELVNSNLRGAFFLTQDLSEELRKRHGAIVNLVDTHADKPLLHHSVYSIAKAGVKAMTRSLESVMLTPVFVAAFCILAMTGLGILRMENMIGCKL